MGLQLYQERNVGNLLKRVKDVGSTPEHNVRYVFHAWAFRAKPELSSVDTNFTRDASIAGKRRVELRILRVPCAELLLMYLRTVVGSSLNVQEITREV